MVVIQVVLLFGSKTRVVNPWLEKSLAVFHHRLFRWIAGMGLERQLNRIWVYPSIGAALATVGLEDIGVYNARRQITVAQYIATHPIMDLCLVE